MEREKWSMKDQIKKTRLLINNKVDSRKLVPGDHIYAYRGIRLYSHHGIYLGNEQVIHFITTETKPEKVGKHKPACRNCGHQTHKHLGVVKTCLDYFISEGSHFSGHTLRRCQYEVSESWYKMKRAGSCSTSASKPSNEVIDIATSLYENNDFGDYDLLDNNCESFATYCKTGVPKSAQVDKFGGRLTKGMLLGASIFIKSASASTSNTGDEDEDDDEEEEYHHS